jgi:NADH dehydrogenase FAD-containing subunit
MATIDPRIHAHGSDGPLLDLPGVAPVAMQQARYAARLIRDQRPFAEKCW